MTRSRRSPVLPLAALGGVAAIVGATVLPASAFADTPATPGCTSCTATYNTPGTSSFAIPTGATKITVTISGSTGAGAPKSISGYTDTNFSLGGVTTVNLGSTYAGHTLIIGVGGLGEGSYLQSGTTLLAVAGGGGNNGYAGYLDDVEQISGTYAGGNGGSPSGPGVAPGTDGTAFIGTPQGQAANGAGGTTTGGAAGVGDDVGTAGASTVTTTVAGTTLAAGGTGGTFTDTTTGITHNGGVGGTGYTGGGGGAIVESLPAGDFPVGLVAPGGGGAGYLDPSLTATAGTGNSKAASVVFHWTAAALPITGVSDPTVPLELSALFVLLGSAAVAATTIRRRRNA